MKASELRALTTAGPVLSCSPVVIEDEHGNRFEIVGRSAAVPSETDSDGRKKPAGVPVLRLVIRQLSPAPGESTGGAS